MHALAVLHQLTWLVDADPFVLLQLRGLPRDELLARLHARAAEPGEPDGATTSTPAWTPRCGPPALLALLDDTDQPVDHLF